MLAEKRSDQSTVDAHVAVLCDFALGHVASVADAEVDFED
jgi:hypothetical protein